MLQHYWYGIAPINPFITLAEKRGDEIKKQDFMKSQFCWAGILPASEQPRRLSTLRFNAHALSFWPLGT
jgi:hypothetical protein